MEIKKGIPVSHGIAIGHVFVLDSEESRIPKRFVTPKQVKREVNRYLRALEAAVTEVKELISDVSRRLGKEYLPIFNSHLNILEDQTIRNEVVERIEKNNFTAEYAVSRVFRKYIKAFKAMEDIYFRERVTDIYDIEKRLFKTLLHEQREGLGNLAKQVIVVAQDLTPSETVQLDREKVIAFATDRGGATSHTAIMAKALGIPAVVGLETITTDLSGGDLVIIDGNSGSVIISPDEETLSKYREKKHCYEEFERGLASTVTETPSETRDGVRVHFWANIEFPREISLALSLGSEGIGLYRTEFIYATSSDPSENEHFECYRESIELLGGRPLVIRTLDFGADKFAHVTGRKPERNPFLGCRSLRLCFEHLEVFKRQLRAILRATMLGPLKLMFPMITSVTEWRRARMILKEVMEDLTAEGIPYQTDFPVGIMVEVPSAALTLEQFLPEVDFISIGSNDLTQYTLAVDRVNEVIAYMYQPAHPAVLGLMRRAITLARQADKDVSVCGEICGDVSFTLLLLGMGLRDFSAAPVFIPAVKQVVRSVTVAQAVAVAERAEKMATAEEIMQFLQTETRKLCPEVF